jgi:hypothetical protein
VSTPSPAAATSSLATAGSDTWQQLTDFPASDAFDVTSVTADGTGFLAVGYGQMPDEGYYGRHQGIVWRSSDGHSWTAEADPAFQYTTPEKVLSLGDSAYIFGSIAMCDALFADEDCVEPAESGWAVWRSTAGAAWERLPQLKEMQLGSVDGAAATENALVALGWTGDDAEPVVWTSADGVSWTSIRELPQMTQVTAAGAAADGLVAFGNKYSEELDDLELVGALAADSVHFTSVAAPTLSGTTMRSLARGANAAIAGGETEDEDLNTTAVVLSSADGATWTQAAASDGTFSDSAIAFVHSLDTGFAAIGTMATGDAFDSVTGRSWFSSDGQSWRLLAPFGGEFSLLDASAAGAPGVVAFTATSQESDDDNVVSTVAAWLARPEALAALH